MSRRNLKTTENQQESDAHSSNSKKTKYLFSGKSKRKLLINRQHSSNRHSSYQSSSILTSLAKITDHQENDRKSRKAQQLELEHIMPSFTEKYLPKGSTAQQIYQQMLSVSIFKEREIQTMRVYRDQLKFISSSSPYTTPMKVSIKLLQEKAEIESKIKAQKLQIQEQIKQMKIENKNVKHYKQIVTDCIKQQQQSHQVLDMGKQKQIMIENIKKQIMHIVQELNHEKKKNLKEIRNIQDKISELRIKIKQKEDNLRETKARICTLYIKLHSRNSSASRSKDKNMSMSVRKFNTSKNQTVREVFIGNAQFKNYSKEILEKVEDSQLVKIKFYSLKNRKLIFRCVYQKKQGILHSHEFDYLNKVDSLAEIKEEFEPIFVKYLMSIKFYFKSSLVGVECRVKTQKGNRHIQVGNCESYVEHELVTLVNRKLMTLGSYWHGKEMIGVSVWFMQQVSFKNAEASKKVQDKKNNGNSFQEYFT